MSFYSQSFLFNRSGKKLVEKGGHFFLTQKCNSHEVHQSFIHTALDATVLEYLAKERAAGHPVSNKELMAKALQFVLQMNIPPTFKALSMWIKTLERT